MAAAITQAVGAITALSSANYKNSCYASRRSLPERKSSFFVIHCGGSLSSMGPGSNRPDSTQTRAPVIKRPNLTKPPYIDDDYGDPKVEEEADRLVEEEMRRSSKKPSDFLKDLPPLPKFDFQDHPALLGNMRGSELGSPQYK